MLLLQPSHDRFTCLRRPDLVRRGADLPNARLLTRNIEGLVFSGSNQGPQFNSVVETNQSFLVPKEDGKWTVNQCTSVNDPDGLGQFHLSVIMVDLCPRRGSQSHTSDLDRETMLSQKKVEEVGHHLRVGHQGTLISKHLQIPFVNTIRRDLPIMDDGKVEQGEGMGPSPPSWCIGGEATMSDPRIAFILLQTIKPSHIIREANRLKGTHVFST